MPDNLETAILNALYRRFESHPGSPRMTLGQLYVDIGVPPNEGGEVREVHRQLLSLKQKHWVEYQILEDGSGGVVEITPEAIRIVQDRQQTPMKMPSAIQSETAQGTLPQRDRVPSWWQLLLVSVLNLVAGIFGNLIASWIQQEWVRNAFTLPRITIILLSTGIVIVTEVWLRRQTTMNLRKRVAIIGVLIALTAVIAVTLPIPWPTNAKVDPPSPTPATIYYTVQVIVQDTGEDIPYAQVRLDIGEGKAPLFDVTDSNGLARIPLDARDENRPAVLIVEASGYKKSRKEIHLTNNDSAQVVPLEPIH